MTKRAVVGFDWDDGNRAKCRKHGVSIAEIEAVFGHPHRIAPDLAHSIAETRFLAIGNGGGHARFSWRSRCVKSAANA